MTNLSKFAALCIATSIMTASPAFAVTTPAHPAPAAHVVKPATPHVVATKPAAAHPVAAAKPAVAARPAPAKTSMLGGLFGGKPAVAPRSAAPSANGRMVRARLANGQMVTYNCSLAGNAAKTACKR